MPYILTSLKPEQGWAARVLDRACILAHGDIVHYDSAANLIAYREIQERYCSVQVPRPCNALSCATLCRVARSSPIFVRAMLRNSLTTCVLITGAVTRIASAIADSCGSLAYA
jgi:hypothetical protein